MASALENCSQWALDTMPPGGRFDLARAMHARNFIEKFCAHTKGRWAGERFELLDWQWRELIAPMFGCVVKDGTRWRRRFRKASVWIPKKNGKSTLAASIALYMLVGDGETGAEVYVTANDRRQAGIVFNEALRVARNNTALWRAVRVNESIKRIAHPRSDSFLEALSAEHGTKEGLNWHGLITDEVHAAPNPRLLDTLRYGSASRTEPLWLLISTAGVFDAEAIGWQEYWTAKQVRDGAAVDPTVLPVIYEADKDDDWRDPATWAKANPSFGHTVFADEMETACTGAAASGRLELQFRRYRLNQWVQSFDRWLSPEMWELGNLPVTVSPGDPCYVGLDLASTRDLTALVCVFPKTTEGGTDYHVVPRFFAPEAKIKASAESDGIDYWAWHKQGLIDIAGDTHADLEVVMDAVRQIVSKYSVVELAYDRQFAGYLIDKISAEGVTCVEVPQRPTSMNPGCRELERLVARGQVIHGGHPVLRWNAMNVGLKKGLTDLYYPIKPTETARIDGVVALIMALHRASMREAATSVYDSYSG